MHSVEVTEQAVAQALVRDARQCTVEGWPHPVDVEWIRVFQYELLGLMTGLHTEAEFREFFKRGLPRYANSQFGGERYLQAGLKWARQRWAELSKQVTVDIRPGYGTRYYSTVNLTTGKEYKERPTTYNIDPEKKRQDKVLVRVARELAFPAVRAGDPKLEEFHLELVDLRRNGEENMDHWWDIGNRADSLRILSAIRREFVTKFVGPTGAAQGAGVPGWVGKIVKRIFALDDEGAE